MAHERVPPVVDREVSKPIQFSLARSPRSNRCDRGDVGANVAEHARRRRIKKVSKMARSAFRRPCDIRQAELGSTEHRSRSAVARDGFSLRRNWDWKTNRFLTPEHD
jgi:hypothetical protein